MKKVLLFDFAGVIGSESYFGWLKKNIPNYVERKAEFQVMANKADLGKVTPEEFFELVSGVTGIPQKNVWQEIYEPVTINQELVAFIKQLKSSYKIVLFSNYHGVLLRRLLQKHQIEDLFDDIFISSEQQAKKPDEDAFLKILDRIKAGKDEVIFIDDRSENTEAGQKMGIDSIVFRSVDQLKDELGKMVINT